MTHCGERRATFCGVTSFIIRSWSPILKNRMDGRPYTAGLQVLAQSRIRRDFNGAASWQVTYTCTWGVIQNQLTDLSCSASRPGQKPWCNVHGGEKVTRKPRIIELLADHQEGSDIETR